MTNNSTWKKTSALLIGGLVVGGLSAGALLDDGSNTIKNLTADLADVEADLETTQGELTLLQEADPEVVDNGNLALVLEHLYDNDGLVEYLTEDLDDDEVDQIVEKVVFVNEVRALAVDAVRADLYDEVDKLVVGEGDDAVELDEDELRRLRIDDDQDELLFELVDWEDRDATVHVTGTFRQDDQAFNFELDVIFEDGEFDELDNVEVTAQ